MMLLILCTYTANNLTIVYNITNIDNSVYDLFDRQRNELPISSKISYDNLFLSLSFCDIYYACYSAVINHFRNTYIDFKQINEVFIHDIQATIWMILQNRIKEVMNENSIFFHNFEDIFKQNTGLNFELDFKSYLDRKNKSVLNIKTLEDYNDIFDYISNKLIYKALGCMIFYLKRKDAESIINDIRRFKIHTQSGAGLCTNNKYSFKNNISVMQKKDICIQKYIEFNSLDSFDIKSDIMSHPNYDPTNLMNCRIDITLYLLKYIIICAQFYEQKVITKSKIEQAKYIRSEQKIVREYIASVCLDLYISFFSNLMRSDYETENLSLNTTAKLASVTFNKQKLCTILRYYFDLDIIHLDILQNALKYIHFHVGKVNYYLDFVKRNMINCRSSHVAALKRIDYVCLSFFTDFDVLYENMLILGFAKNNSCMPNFLARLLRLITYGVFVKFPTTGVKFITYNLCKFSYKDVAITFFERLTLLTDEDLDAFCQLSLEHCKLMRVAFVTLQLAYKKDQILRYNYSLSDTLHPKNDVNAHKQSTELDVLIHENQREMSHSWSHEVYLLLEHERRNRMRCFECFNEYAKESNDCDESLCSTNNIKFKGFNETKSNNHFVSSRYKFIKVS